MLDLIIRNGTVVDGSGEARFRADVGIEAGTIALINERIDQPARQEVDAAGLIVAPGFIDWHSHSDLNVLISCGAANQLEQGVTTEITGHCGVSITPYTGEFVSNIGCEVTPQQDADMKAKGGTFQAYLDELAKLDMPTNIATFTGHGTLRNKVMGNQMRAPTPQEMEEMKALLAQAMQSGCMGLTSGLLYPPGSWAQNEELLELAKVAAEYGGIYTTHMRDEGDYVVESVQESIALAEAAGIPLVISHHKVSGLHNEGTSAKTIALMDEARARGLEVQYDQYPYDGGGTNLLSALPPKYAEGGRHELMARLKNPGIRAEIREMLRHPGGREYENLIYGGGYDRVILYSDGHPQFNGYTLESLGKEQGKDPLDAMLDLLSQYDDIFALFRLHSEWDVENILRCPYAMTGTDGDQTDERHPFWHPRCYATYPRILGTFCREKKLFELEDCIWRFTGMSARRAGFTRKGLIRPGYDADLVLFNFDTIAGNADYGSADVPNEGISYVFVNGTMAVKHGKITGGRGGRAVLRGE